MENKLLSLLGIARRAGKISLGLDASRESMEKAKAELLILSEDISENSSYKAVKKAEEFKIPIIRINMSMDEIEMKIGKRSGIITVNDKGFAKRITELATEIQGG